jgi:transposase
MGAQHVRHMQKALDQMNLQIHRVLSDITGVSGQRILNAILEGDRDPVRLAQLCHGGVKSSQEKIAKALEGDYRPEHLFPLKQSLFGYHTYQKMIAEVDEEIEANLKGLPTADQTKTELPKRTKKRPYQRQHYEPAFNLRKELFRIFGVDMTDVPGISAVTAHTILSEIGTDLNQFRNASAFASWLGLCPEKQISGGKVLYVKTRAVKNRVALALRLAAHSLHHADNSLGEFFRRIKRRLGPAQAITATAHKLARIVFHLLKTREPYDDTVFQKQDMETRRRAESRLRCPAARLGLRVIAVASEQPNRIVP